MRKALALLLLVGSAVAQSAIGFVSPNTRDSMSYADAKVSLTSFEQSNFIAVADRVLCALTPRARVDSAIGEVHEKGKLGLEGAENGTVLKAEVPLETMRYALALLGRYAHQKFVIVFASQRKPGAHPARLVTLRTGKRTARLALERALDQAGVLHRTLADDHTVLTYLPGDASDAPIRKAAERLQARLEVETGSGELIGDDDRARAAAAYDKIIAEFEAIHPQQKLSPQLWSKEWHEADSRTCTAP